MSERRRVISVSPLLMAATAFEDEQSIQPLLALMRTNVTIEDTPGTVLLLHHQAEALLAIKKDKASVNHFLQHKDVATAMKSGDAGAIFCYHVFCCQLWRKTNHHAKAMEHFVKADKALRETRKDYLHRITVRMLHERNALLLFQRNKKAEESVDRGSQARAHLERLRRKGFACVRPWLVEIAEKD